MNREFLEIIKTRRSIRNYKAEMIPNDLLEAVVEAGTFAPTAMGKQSPTIIAVTDPIYREKLSKMNAAVMGSEQDPYYGAPVIILVLGDPSMPTFVEDGSCVLENMMLAAQSLGLGSCWIHRAKEMYASEEGKAFLAELGVEGDVVGVGHCILGYPDGELPEAPARKQGRVFYVR